MISPLAPQLFPELPAIAGVQLATFAAELRYKGRPDLFLAVVPADTAVAATFTTSRCPSAPVDWCKKHIGSGTGRAVVVNAGNANAFTGAAGYEAAVATAEAAARALGVAASEVYLSSTGVIGELLSADSMTAAIGPLVDELTESSSDGWASAANAIRTTDTFAKGASRTIGGCSVVGIAKGSGMIAPDMATMLGYIFTDVSIDAARLQRLTSQAVGTSFNRVTVDSDTSTSDTVLVFATGAGGHEINDSNEGEFAAALNGVALDLAHQIVRDGEGATKFVSVNVDGAETEAAAERIARAIADSPLVKTALAAEDANWGRVVMAVGKAGEPADRDRLAIWFGDVRVAVNGERDPDYSEAAASAVMEREHIVIRTEIGLGEGSATVWTCDLTKAYVEINGDYRS